VRFLSFQSTGSSRSNPTQWPVRVVDLFFPTQVQVDHSLQGAAELAGINVAKVPGPMCSMLSCHLWLAGLN